MPNEQEVNNFIQNFLNNGGSLPDPADFSELDKSLHGRTTRSFSESLTYLGDSLEANEDVLKDMGLYTLSSELIESIDKFTDDDRR